jgi:hypothetical protein
VITKFKLFEANKYTDYDPDGNFNVGDRVIVNGHYVNITFKGESGTIINFYEAGDNSKKREILIRFDSRFNTDLMSGDNNEDPSGTSYYVTSDLVELEDKTPGKIKWYSKGLWEKYNEIDPYNEEDWDDKNQIFVMYKGFMAGEGQSYHLHVVVNKHYGGNTNGQYLWDVDKRGMPDVVKCVSVYDPRRHKFASSEEIEKYLDLEKLESVFNYRNGEVRESVKWYKNGNFENEPECKHGKHEYVLTQKATFDKNTLKPYYKNEIKCKRCGSVKKYCKHAWSYYDLVTQDRNGNNKVKHLLRCTKCGEYETDLSKMPKEKGDSFSTKIKKIIKKK